MMELDHIITLDDGSEFYVLMENEIVDGDYYLTVEVDKEENFTSNYKIFKLITDEDEEYVEEVDDPDLLNQLLIDYDVQYSEQVDDIVDEIEEQEKNENKE